MAWSEGQQQDIIAVLKAIEPMPTNQALELESTRIIGQIRCCSPEEARRILGDLQASGRIYLEILPAGWQLDIRKKEPVSRLRWASR